MKKHVIYTKSNGPKISKHIYGQFAEHLGRCIYEGIWVGENSPIENVNGIRQDVVQALRELEVPVLRWPGGCFADEYHWMDGIGPKESRKKIVNTHWGGVTENNHFGTHEFFELVEQLGTEAYINGNVGSGTVKEMSDWVEYMTMPGESPMADLRRENGREEPWRVHYFGVGNESWGCGGHMTPDYYADLYRRYQTYVRQYGEDKIYKIACGPNIDDYNWMEVMMQKAAPFMDGISLHHYALADEWENKRPATGFPVEEWYSLIDSAKKMDELITKHSQIMDKYDPEKRIGLIVDEWGSWLRVEDGTNPGFLYQQNTIRDAMVASITLNIFHKHADRVHMANIAQMINVLQSMILTHEDKIVLTPSYYVFYLYKNHQDATAIEIAGTESENISHTASKKDNKVTLSICNYSHDETKHLTYELDSQIKSVRAEYITGESIDSHNTFDNPNVIAKQDFTHFSRNENILELDVPSKSVITLELELI